MATENARATAERVEAAALNRVSAARTSASYSDGMDDMSNYKFQEAEKVVIPSYPLITALVAWQTALVGAVAVASGNPNYKLVTMWLSQCWAGGHACAFLGDSGGKSFVMLDMKLSTAMQVMISNA